MRWKAVVLVVVITISTYYAVHLNSFNNSERIEVIVSAVRIPKVIAKPNIILIVADDLGWNDVGWHQNKKTMANPFGGKTTNMEIKTPVLDKLVKEGIELGRLYVQALCSPTRSALMTGRYPHHTGTGPDYIRNERPYGVPIQEVFLSQLLKKSSYSTHIVGKWHLGFCNKAYTPTSRGFDSFVGLLTGSSDHYTHSSNWRDLWNGPFYLDLHNNSQICSTENSTYSMNLFTREAVRIINNHANNLRNPLFLYFSLQAVHKPLQVPHRFLTPYQQQLPNDVPDRDMRIKMAGMVTNMDEGIGEVVGALRNRKMLDNSIIIFMSDNGGDIPQSSNYPFRGQKRTNWEGGIRSPGFIRGTTSGLGQLPRGIKFNKLMHVTDWLPTLVRGMLGESTKNCKRLDGVDQWNALRGISKPPRESLAVTIPPTGFSAVTVVVDRYKLLTAGENCERTEQFVHPGFNVLPISPPEPVVKDKIEYWVFDVISDPTESVNLASNNTLLKFLKKFAISQQKYAIPDISTQVQKVDPSGNPKVNGGSWGPFSNSTMCPKVLNTKYSKV